MTVVQPQWLPKLSQGKNHERNQTWLLFLLTKKRVMAKPGCREPLISV